MTTSSEPSVVLHLMRTYGRHGGEQQLSQYLASEPRGSVEEHFAFVYRDPDCAALFTDRGARAELHALWPTPVTPRRSPWSELAILMLLLPVLQLRFLALSHRLSARVCVVHGFQAALVAWPTAVIRPRSVRFLYVHRITKTMGRGRAVRWIYRPFQLLGGVSQAVTDSLAPLAKSCRLIPLENGIDWRRVVREAEVEIDIADKGKGPVIATIGRLLPHKGHALVVDAFSQVRQRFPTARLWIIGDGPTRDALAAQVDGLGLADAVTFWGHRADVPRLMGRASAFAYASTWEGMSNAVLEAMALGRPSVVVDAPGVTECHVNGETGRVVARAPQAIAEVLIEFLEHPDKAAAMGEAARQRVRERYSIEANRQRFLAAYDRLLTEV